MCPEEPIISDICQFNVSGYFSYKNYTVVVIISNDVSKEIKPYSILLYKGKYILFVDWLTVFVLFLQILW